mgnify:FL=1
MSDYIDRAALGIGSCNRDVFENKSYADGWNAAVKILKEAPAVDVIEVRHGYWIPISDGEGAECSECGEYYDTRQTGGMTAFRQFQKFYAYCSCCGAKWMVTAVADIFICPDKNCVWLIKTGGERPLCPFRGCLKHKPKKTTGKKKETVK